MIATHLNASQIADGATIISPLPMDTTEFCTLMAEEGLMISNQGVTTASIPGAGGTGFMAFGKGCFGYLTDIEGFEADEWHLEAFLLKVLPEGGSITISGQYRAADDRVILSEATHTVIDRRVVTRECRRLVFDDGGQRIIRCVCDVDQSCNTDATVVSLVA